MRRMSCEEAVETATRELREYAKDNGLHLIPRQPRPPILTLRGPLLGFVVAWKWSHENGLSYSVRLHENKGHLTMEYPTIGEAMSSAQSAVLEIEDEIGTIPGHAFISAYHKSTAKVVDNILEARDSQLKAKP